MKDEGRIIEYLDKQFKVRVATHHYVIVGVDVESVKDVYEMDDLSQDIQEVLGYESWQAQRAILSWYRDKVKTLNQHFYDFMEPYKVEMNMVDWDVLDSDGNKLDMYVMFRELDKYYEVPEIITRMYEDWRLKKIIEYSENRDDLFGSYEIIT